MNLLLLIAASQFVFNSVPVPETKPPAWVAGFCEGYNQAAKTSGQNLLHLHSLYDVRHVKGASTKKLMQIIEKAELGYLKIPELPPGMNVELYDRGLSFTCPVPDDVIKGSSGDGPPSNEWPNETPGWQSDGSYYDGCNWTTYNNNGGAATTLRACQHPTWPR